MKPSNGKTGWTEIIIKQALGRRIIAIDQRSFYDEENRVRRHEVLTFTLDDGSVIYFGAFETIDQPGVKAWVQKKRKKP